MTPERFCDWLQGFVELTETDNISERQWLVIKDHLKLVFDKKTPDRTEEVKLDIRPNSTGPVDWKQLSDLIGKEHTHYPYLKPPYTITC